MGPKDIIDSTFSIFEKYSTWRQLKKDTGAILRLLYLESKRNSSLLSCIQLETKNRGLKKQDTGYKEIVSAFQTDVLELVFMAGKSNSKVFEFMKDSSGFEIDDDDPETPEKEYPLNALSFLYVKIWTLKKLVSLNPSQAVKNINYRVRLRNIQSAYRSLLISLERLPEIAPLIRERG